MILYHNDKHIKATMRNSIANTISRTVVTETISTMKFMEDKHINKSIHTSEKLNTLVTVIQIFDSKFLLSKFK